jgi:Tfp pilus assembly protein FimT
MTELIVVIAVIGIIMAVSVPTLWTYFRTATLRGAAEELVTVLNGARQLAIRSNSTVCVTNDGTRVQYHLSTCGATTWKGPGTDSSGNITLSNSVRAGGSSNVCYSYLGATTATPAPCVNAGTLTVTNPAGGSTMSVTVATTGRAKIQ